MTSLTDSENELKGRQLGADDYVTKPLDFDMLATIIAARLAGVARTGLWPKTIALNEREIDGVFANIQRRLQETVGATFRA